jgi:PASTA domain-containing protein
MNTTPRPTSLITRAPIRFGVVVAALIAFLICSASASAMKISEFRLRGPSGPLDEFVELYNESAQPVTVSTADGSEGWALAASNGVARFVIPNGTVIPPHGHILGVNSGGYSLTGAAAGDLSYTADIPDNAGIALFRTANPANFTLANRLDAVGSTSEVNALYKEGTGYPALTPFSIDYSFTRNPLSGTVPDTDNNAADFLFVDTNGTSAGAGQRLGTPGPENSLSPVLGFNTVAVSALDPSQPPSASPNFVRDFTSDPAHNSTFGTITIRRRLTNNSGVPLTRLALRIVDITTFPSPSGISDLRPRTSADTTVGGTTVRGTTLEQPPSQPNGGGFNSSMWVPAVTPVTPLQPGASIAIQVLIGIQQTGSYRFCAQIEATPSAGGTFADVGNTDAGAPGVTQCAPVPPPPPVELAVSAPAEAQTIQPPAEAPPAAPKCHVPNLKGKTLKAAKKLIRSKGCTVGEVKKKHGVTVATGKVAGQSPAAGKAVVAGTKVKLTLD